MSHFGRLFLSLFALVASIVTDRVLLGDEQLLEAHPDEMLFELSNARIERQQLQHLIAFDYKLVRGGKLRSNMIEIRGRSKDGPLESSATVNTADKEGTIRLEMQSFLTIAGVQMKDYSPLSVLTADLELYFVNKVWLPRNTADVSIKASNSIKLGVMNGETRGRPWSKEELEGYQLLLKAGTDPGEPPEGYVRLEKSQELVPGVKILYEYFGSWRECELVAIDKDGYLSVRLDDKGAIVTVTRNGWLAISNESLQLLKTNRSALKPSIRVTPGGNAEFAANEEPLPSDIELPIGIPLAVKKQSSQEEDHYFLSFDENRIYATLFFKNSRFGPRTTIASIDTLAIDSKLLAELQTGVDADRFVSNVRNDEVFEVKKFIADDLRTVGDRKLREEKYSPRLLLPKNLMPLAANEPLRYGQVLAVCNFQWQVVTVIDKNPQELVAVSFNETNNEYLDCRIKRNQLFLILDERTGKPIVGDESNASIAEPAFDTTESEFELRTWIDSTGKYKIKGRYAESQEDAVVIKKEDGSETRIKKSKLSRADKEYVAHVEDDNPFENSKK